jgi:hypothetical protein
MAEEKDKKYVWLNKKEFLDNSVERHLILKILYYLGMYRFRDLTEYAEKHKREFISPDKKQIHSNFRYIAWLEPRWWHPLMWAFAIIVVVIAFIQEFFKIIRSISSKDFTSELHIYKPLRTEDGEKVY